MINELKQYGLIIAQVASGFLFLLLALALIPGALSGYNVVGTLVVLPVLAAVYVIAGRLRDSR